MPTADADAPEANASSQDARPLLRRSALGVKATSPSSEPTPPQSPKRGGRPRKPNADRAAVAEQIIDDILSGADADADKTGAEVTQRTKTALKVIEMEARANKDADKPRAFGNVVIQKKLTEDEWNEMRERMRGIEAK